MKKRNKLQIYFASLAGKQSERGKVESNLSCGRGKVLEPKKKIYIWKKNNRTFDSVLEKKG